ncbi:MAG TPA: rhomboid family intramembrane serine protease [Vicinamibacterales bacterium]|jgi:membrane associated rhomboid family serine protease|nr:rhomboid family intramembrane serine protease [Vicinamibacterales bacterium]
MRPRSYSGSNFAYSFGPGQVTPAVKALLIINIGVFVLQQAVGGLLFWFGLQPAEVLTGLRIWQPLTYMFLHGSISHILFNMLSLWMFGVEMERMWGTRFFTRYYLVCGVGAAATTILMSFFPGSIGEQLYLSRTVGASGAIYGLLLAYALYFPDRPILMSFLFPVPAKYFVMIIGAIAFLSAAGSGGGGVAHVAHLGGLLVGWFYLRGRRVRLAAEIQYQFSRWRINRARRRFDVHQGGRPPRDQGPRYH